MPTLRRDPTKRPTAKELLNDPRLPRSGCIATCTAGLYRRWSTRRIVKATGTSCDNCCTPNDEAAIRRFDASAWIGLVTATKQRLKKPHWKNTRAIC